MNLNKFNVTGWDAIGNKKSDIVYAELEDIQENPEDYGFHGGIANTTLVKTIIKPFLLDYRFVVVKGDTTDMCEKHKGQKLVYEVDVEEATKKLHKFFADKYGEDEVDCFECTDNTFI